MTYSIKTLVGILSDSDLEERISVLEEKLSNGALDLLPGALFLSDRGGMTILSGGEFVSGCIY